MGDYLKQIQGSHCSYSKYYYEADLVIDMIAYSTPPVDCNAIIEKQKQDHGKQVKEMEITINDLVLQRNLQAKKTIAKNLYIKQLELQLMLGISIIDDKDSVMWANRSEELLESMK